MLLSSCWIPGTNGSSCEGVPEQHASDHRRRQTSQLVTGMWAIRQCTQFCSCEETTSVTYTIYNKQYQQCQRGEEGNCQYQVWWVQFVNMWEAGYFVLFMIYICSHDLSSWDTRAFSSSTVVCIRSLGFNCHALN